MADDVRTVLESVSVALESKNLQQKEGRCHLDYVMAYGGAVRKLPGSSSFIRLRLTSLEIREELVLRDGSCSGDC